MYMYVPTHPIMLPVHGQLYVVVKWCQAENYSATLATGRPTVVQYSYSGTIGLTVPVIFYRCAHLVYPDCVLVLYRYSIVPVL